MANTSFHYSNIRYPNNDFKTSKLNFSTDREQGNENHDGEEAGLADAENDDPDGNKKAAALSSTL